jgi:multiple sugar transport system permease protein
MTTSQASPVALKEATARPAKLGRDPIKHKRAILGFLAPFGVLFALFYLVPVGYAIYQSFLKIQREGAWGVPETVFGGLAQVPIMLGLALIFALLLDSTVLKGKKFFRLAFFAPYAVPGVIASIMWGFLYVPSLTPFPALTDRIDFLGSGFVLWSIANIVIWVYCGYNMLILYSALQAIPQEIYEAARVDGAGQFRLAWDIKIPIVMPAIILTAVFSIIGTLQLFNEPFVLRTFSGSVTSTYTPNMVVYSTSVVPNYNLAAAFSVVLALATFILSFVFLKLTQKRAFA